LNLLKKGLESPGKVLEFHLHQSVDTLVRLLFYTLFIIASAGKKRRSSKENVARSNDVINKVLQTTFGKLLTKAGVILTSGEVQNKISKSQVQLTSQDPGFFPESNVFLNDFFLELDQTMFQRNLYNTLKRHQHYPQVLKCFIN
jgi:hypothetical protein